MGKTPKEYNKMLRESSPPSQSAKTLPMAFLVLSLIHI